MRGGSKVWLGLLIVGLSGLIGMVLSLPNRPDRPEATGDVGVLMVFAQMPSGPVRLPPSRKVRLPRPQDFAFRFVANGTGPRYVRIELDSDDRTEVVFEEKMATPADAYLDYVLRLDEGAADSATLIVVVEAPHMMSAVSEFPLALEGAERPFWEPKTATATAAR